MRTLKFRSAGAVVLSVLFVGTGAVGVHSVRAAEVSAPPTTNGNPPVPPPEPPVAAATGPINQRFASTSDPVAADHPVAYWLLDDAATAAQADDSARPPRIPHPGTYTAGVAASTEGPGRDLTGSRSFNGTPCAGVVVDAPTAQFSQTFSVEGWVKTSAASGVVFRWRWYGYLLRLSGGRAQFEVSSGSGGGFVAGTVIGGTSIVSDGTWHHLAGVRTPGPNPKIQLYVDGTLEAEAVVPTASTFYGLPREAAIGRDGNACDGAIPSMNGKIAALALFDTALSPTQVSAHAALDPAPIPPDWAQWTQGDVHVHASGDNELTNNRACTQEQIKAGQTVRKYVPGPRGVGGAWVTTNAKQTESGCARLLVDRIVRRAQKSDADWLILTEHGAWLGLKWSFLWPHYDHAKGERQLAAVAAAAKTATGVQLLTGEEMGTAAGPSTWCGDVNNASGHLGVYYTPRMVPNSYTDCDEIGYVKKLKAVTAVGIAGPNHPDNGDGGSDWHCWTGDPLLDTYPWDNFIGSCNGSIYAYANNRAINRDTPTTAITRSLEVISDDHTPSAKAWTRVNQWVGSGFGIAMVGGSDSHTTARGSGHPDQNKNNDGKVGLRGRTFARTGALPTTNEQTLSSTHPVRKAIEQGRTIASTGPLFVPRVGTSEPGEETNATRSSINVDVFWPDTTAKVLSDDIDNLDSDATPPTVSISQRPLRLEYRLYQVRKGCIPTGGTFDQQSVFCAAPTVTSTTVTATGNVQRQKLQLPSGVSDGRFALIVRAFYPDSPWNTSDPGSTETRPVEASSSPIYISVGNGSSDSDVPPTDFLRASTARSGGAADAGLNLATVNAATNGTTVEVVVHNAVATPIVSGISQFQAACSTGGTVTSLGPIPVPWNATVSLGSVARGSVCTVAQSPSNLKTVSGTVLTHASDALHPDDPELGFYFASAVPGRPADVIIESVPLGALAPGTAIAYDVSCNNGPVQRIASTVGQITALSGHYVGDICTVAYDGPGLSGLEPATQRGVLFERYRPDVEHPVLAPFSYTFSTAELVAPSTPMARGTQLKIQNATVAVPVGGSAATPLTTAAARVHAVLSMNPQGKLTGNVQLTLPGSQNQLVARDATVEITESGIVVNATAKIGNTGYDIQVIAPPGTPGAVRIIVADSTGAPVLDTAPTLEPGDTLPAVLSGTVTYG